MACTGLRVLGKDGQELPITQFHATINIQLSTAFVTLVGEFRTKSQGQKVLEFPIGSNVTITNCAINTEGRSIGTCVVSADDLTTYSAQNHKFRSHMVQLDKTKFMLPFELGKHDRSVHITLNYFYALSFDAETWRYTFHLPATFNDPSNIESASIKFGVNTASPSQYVQYGCSSHKFKQVSDSDPWLKNFEVDGWENRDFEFNYQVTTTDIVSTVMVNHANVDPFDPRATFCVNIHPPPDSNLTNGFFGRRIVFLIDISGSMENDPIAQAKNALHTGLTQLRHMWDHFTVIAFNDKLLTWSEALVEANPGSIQAAIDWVGGLQAKGQTDILLAVQSATTILSNPAFAGDNRIPMVFLLTDGAVKNEKDIHRFVVEQCQNIRFHTLGIGDEANAYFLKMLAMAGRGLNDHIVNYKNIFKQVLSLIRASTTPILTNIEVLLPVQSNQYEIFPYPVPDLFCGHPIMLAGKVAVNFDHALVRGLLPNGQVFQVQVKPQFSNVELHKVFAKQRLDYMVGQAWVSGNSVDIAAYIKYSSMYCMPTPHTVMVAYNKNPKKQHDSPPHSVSDLALMSVGGVIVLAGLALSLGGLVYTMNSISRALAPDPFSGPSHTLHSGGYGGGGGGGGNGNCCECMDATFCCCCNNEPCCGCCRPNRGHSRGGNFGSGSGSGDCCYFNGYSSSGGNDCCCGGCGGCDCCGGCKDCCNCGTGAHCGDCNTCCCNCSGDTMNCDCCGNGGGCVDCCSNCKCDCGACDCGNCDCNCGNCDCGGCDCGGCGNCDCGGCGNC